MGENTESAHGRYLLGMKDVNGDEDGGSLGSEMSSARDGDVEVAEMYAGEPTG